MKHVLVVDGDVSVLHAMQTTLPTYAEELSVLGAEHFAETVGLLHMQAADVVCVCLNMPGLEAFQLLTHMLVHSPTIPVIVMTGHDPSELAQRIDGLGFIDYLHKPLDYQQAADMINMQLDASAGGYVVGITLFGLLELLSLQRVTGVLEIAAGEHEGMLAFADGQLVAAMYDAAVGIDAVYQLFAAQITQIDLHEGTYDVVRTIYTPLAQVLDQVLQHTKNGDGAFTPEPSMGANGASTVLATPTTIVAQAPVVQAAPSDDHAEQSLASGGNDVQTLCARARADAARGNWERAHRSIAQALELDSLCMDAHYVLAQVYEQQGEYDQAITAYRRAVFLDASFVPGILGMATAFKSLGRRPDAQRCYRNALKQLAIMSPDTVIPEVNNSTAGELAIFVSHQLQ